MISIFSSSVRSQYQLEDAVRSDNVLPAEAYKFHFNSAGSVDFHGDYTAQIPLLTVPGRGGWIIRSVSIINRV